MNEQNTVPIQDLIHEIRGCKVMLDSDLARLYEIEVKALNQAVKRNVERFPLDFMFRLTENEWSDLRSHFVTSSSSYGGRRYTPYVFTEQGVAMLSSVIHSKRAIEVNITIMRAFVRLRHIICSEMGTDEHDNNLRKLLMLHIDNCDYKFIEYDESINKIAEVLNNLIEKPKEEKRIGF